MVELDLDRLDRTDRLAVAFIAVFGLAQLAVIASAWDNPMVWDSAVYTAMGKWIFSSGSYGFWENFRPPVLPFLLGLSWRLGLPELGFPRLLSAGISTAGLALVYHGSKDVFDSEVALLATGVLAATHTYFYFSLKPLTGVPAALLIFAGFYLVQKKRPLGGGLALGAAFLTRFPSALAGPAAVGYLLLRGYREGELRERFRDSILVTAGFFALAGAYLAVQYQFFGDLLSPFQRSVSITAGAGNSYLFGLIYMLKAVRANPFLLLAPAGIYFAAREGEVDYGSFAIGFLLFYGFFTSFPLKIERYMLLFLPLMALLSARGLTGVRQYLPQKKYFVKAAFIALLLVFSFNATFSLNSHSWDDPRQQRFFSEVSELEGTVASNDPRVVLYGDFRYQELPMGYLMDIAEHRGGEIDYWAVNQRYWNCNAESCRQDLRKFRDYLEGNTTVTSKILADSYNYTIYRGGGK
ncbi:MAG: ArnT family glycosyltransferase [Candidatus Nanohaloarchaea archaeon]